MASKTYKVIRDLLDRLPIVSSHEHHLPDAMQQNMTLDRILDFSYIGWYAGRKNKPLAETIQLDPLLQVHIREKKYSLPSNDSTKEPREIIKEREGFLDRFGYNSYWVWLEKGIQKIYGFSDAINSNNWERISSQITEQHRNPNSHLDFLRNHGGYLRAVQDTYWDYSSDLGHPELFSPTMRVDMFVTSSHPSLPDHDLNSPFISYPDAPTNDFDGYLDYIKQLFLSWRKKGAVAMKCASAYERTLMFDKTSHEKARSVFYKPKGLVSHEDRIAYGNYMFNWFCELDMQMDIPFQIHTGLAEISDSNPMLFEPVIKRYPKILFVLFHAGFPWCSEIAGLAHNYDNVFIDMVWAPIISTSTAIQALREYIEIAQTSDLIGWGGDTWTSEEAVGAVLAWKHVVSVVLAEMIESGYLNLKKAEILAEKLMYLNNSKIYGFKV